MIMKIGETRIAGGTMWFTILLLLWINNNSNLNVVESFRSTSSSIQRTPRRTFDTNNDKTLQVIINRPGERVRSNTDLYLLDHIGWDEIDTARLQYEALIGPLFFTASSSVSSLSSSVPTTTNKHDNSPQKLTLLTNTARKRRLVEIELLQSLETSDDAVDELMSLWLHGECPSAKIGTQALQYMENDCSSGHEEESIRTIIRQTNGEWMEPISRLALVLFYKGHYRECYDWCCVVLQNKPWHFEIQQLQVLLALAIGNKQLALQYARKGLPPLHQPRRRRKWIQNSVQQAQQILHELEDYDYAIRHSNNNIHPIMETQYSSTTSNNGNEPDAAPASSVWE